jgi:3-hydroxyacyl-[acyl-carrier-protein] dehydratase
MMNQEILERIPQRDPFLYLEEIVSKQINDETKTITASKKITGQEDFFKGHFPGDPIMPGVLICEAAFQTGALLMSYVMEGGITDKTAVVSRIQSAKFKNMVRPGDEIQMTVSLVDQLENAAYMKGKVTANGKTALQIEFACTLVG